MHYCWASSSALRASKISCRRQCIKTKQLLSCHEERQALLKSSYQGHLKSQPHTMSCCLYLLLWCTAAAFSLSRVYVCRILSIEHKILWTLTQVLESEDEETPKAPEPRKQNVVSGGLVGFGVAEDLLNIDFSPPEEAPEEFRARPYNAAIPTEVKVGVSGAETPTFLSIIPQQDP